MRVNKGTDRPRYQGRLELTWTNKDQALLADEHGSYEWVPATDYRVAEVRLLHDVDEVGTTGGVRTRAAENLLIRGDALHGLASLAELPEFASHYRGKVKLAYIDPPFNTGEAFHQYDDALEHSVWLTMMRDRLIQIKKLLSPDGSVWVHLDDSEMAYCKALLDELFGRSNFVATMIWQKMKGRENRTDVSTVHDYILVYAKDKPLWAQKRNLLPFGDDQRARYRNPDDDPRGPWQSGDLTGKAGPGRREAQFYPVELPSGRVVDPPPGRCWLYTRERLDQLIQEGRIWFGPAGDGPLRYKRFLSEVVQGLVPTTLWIAEEVGTNTDAKKEILDLFPRTTPFATPKPERLLQRVLEIGSNQGDLVLDCFVGSGTTAAVAQKMGRRWVGIESSADTVATFTRPRLQRVVAGDDPGGISAVTNWTGGGGFRVLDVAPSMFAAERGVVVLADWATNSALAEATAAQLGFAFELDPPFTGRKGRSRLAVIDGLVNVDVVRLLIGRLDEKERVVVCGTAVDSDATDYLRDTKRGSVRKIPAALLRHYERPSRLKALLAHSAPETGRAPVATS